MWLTAFGYFITFLSWLTGIGKYLHDKAMKKEGAQNQVVVDQGAALEAFHKALRTPQIQTTQELKDDLRSGKL